MKHRLEALGACLFLAVMVLGSTGWITYVPAPTSGSDTALSNALNIVAFDGESDDLQTVVDRGSTATNMGAVTMVGDLTMGTHAIDGKRFGAAAGSGSTGDGFAFGTLSGFMASGSLWGAYGLSAGNTASGDEWGAYGNNAGAGAIHTNSHAFGRYAGRTARGNNRMYLDVYSSDPAYAADGATNDTIFMDTDGTLYLGGGAARAENPSAGGTLRGPWLSTSGLNIDSTLTNHTAQIAAKQTTNSALDAITATDTSNWTTAYGWGDHGTNGYLTTVETNNLATNIAAWVFGALNGTNGVYYTRGTNKWWLLEE